MNPIPSVVLEKVEFVLNYYTTKPEQPWFFMGKDFDGAVCIRIVNDSLKREYCTRGIIQRDKIIPPFSSPITWDAKEVEALVAEIETLKGSSGLKFQKAKLSDLQGV